MASNLRKTIEFCGKSYKKEITKLLIINAFLVIATLGLFYFLKFSIYTFIPVALIGVFDFLFISSFSSKKKKMQEEREDEFISLVSYFQVFINNGINVYQSFKSLINYSSTWMSEQISELIEEIDKDKTVQPFINFANKFVSPIVANVMVSIYQMVDQGDSREQLNQFTIFFSQLSKNNQKNLIDKKERSLSTLDVFPLVGTGLTTILITLSIVLIMGDLVHVF